MEIVKGKIPKAQKVCLYGTEGIGKSTFASKFPDPIFIDTEGSTVHLDVARFPQPEDWQEVYKQVDYVLNKSLKGDYEYKTLVIDTLDWAENLCMEYVCKKYNQKGIESFGYGKGYTYLAEEWQLFLERLQMVVDSGLNVVGLAHAQIKKFERPDQDTAYDRYELKLQKKTAPLVKEWADALLFANYKVYVSVNQNDKTTAKDKGERVMHTTHRATHDAKNRWGLKPELPFEYKEIKDHVFVAGKDKGMLKNDIVGPKNNSVVDTGTKEKMDEDFVEATKKEKEEIKKIFDKDPRIPDEEIKGQVNLDDAREKLAEKQAEAKKTKKKMEEKVEGVEKEEVKVKPELQKLMDEDKVNLDDVMKAVYKRGYYPEGTPYENFEDSFIDGVLIGAWNNGLLQMIKDIKNQKEEF